MNFGEEWRTRQRKTFSRIKHTFLLYKREKTDDARIFAYTCYNIVAPEVKNKPIYTSGLKEWILTEEKRWKEEVWSTKCLLGDKDHDQVLEGI